MVSDMFYFRVCDDCRKRSWVTGGGGWGDAIAMTLPDVLGGKVQKREREIGCYLIS